MQSKAVEELKKIFLAAVRSGGQSGSGKTAWAILGKSGVFELKWKWREVVDSKIYFGERNNRIY